MMDEMTNEKQEKTGMEGLKRAQTFFLGLVFGACVFFPRFSYSDLSQYLDCFENSGA